MRLSFVLILLSATIQLVAQENKTFKVNPGEKITTVLLEQNNLFQYPQFINGVVTYKHGGKGNGLMNYNLLIGEMQFIENNKDTISLGIENEIESIQLGKDTFFFQQGYLQLIDNFSVKIAKRTFLELTNTKRIGGFGESNPTASTYRALWNNGMKELPANEVLTFTEKTTYFIGDRFGHFKPLTKKTLFDFYYKKEKVIEAYFKDHSINFSKEADVQQLLRFLKTL